ncbi:hypothetical protein DFA_11089 [Cavenderia fasciculata]|uniref:Uncharacterized protein n=1 Tax=Cavenderia fasciculata TaxID=261658 RepID=F4QER7_CACFS|nr:uncharacterized protein DFA_11089 [Cavenderia fasciculata]EGG13328.1 hypothetical protein DFA_11089 [Cavenderia fasciculata]|eukprot:XP_004350031.1 hypothetical protein DFA_11089 [Cavenderia fasciculata]
MARREGRTSQGGECGALSMAGIGEEGASLGQGWEDREVPLMAKAVRRGRCLSWPRLGGVGGASHGWERRGWYSQWPGGEERGASLGLRSTSSQDQARDTSIVRLYLQVVAYSYSSSSPPPFLVITNHPASSSTIHNSERERESTPQHK